MVDGFDEILIRLLQQQMVKAQRRLHIREITKKKIQNNSNINEEDINYDQNLGTTTTTINFKDYSLILMN